MASTALRANLFLLLGNALCAVFLFHSRTYSPIPFEFFSAGIRPNETRLARFFSWVSIAVMSLCTFLLTCGIFLFYVVPTIPLITWLFAIFAWIIIVIETVVAIPFWAVASSTSTGDGFVADTGRTGLTLFLNVVIRPILLPVFFFFALTLAVVFSKLIIADLAIFVIQCKEMSS